MKCLASSTSKPLSVLSVTYVQGTRVGRADYGSMRCLPVFEGCWDWAAQLTQSSSHRLSLTAEEDKFFFLLRLYLNSWFSWLMASEQENNLSLHTKMVKPIR